MQNSPSLKIDVIIPAYNASKYIAQTIESVLAQTCLPNKIIVVDDGSTDDTLDIVNRFHSDLIEVISIPNGGVSRARNTGIHASQAEYIAFLDADDVWEPEKLAAQAEALVLHPDKKAVYSYAIMLDECNAVTQSIESYKNIPYLPGEIPTKLLFQFVNISGSASSVMVEANTLKSTALFDEKMSFSEDIDLWFRLSLLTDYACVEKDHVKIRLHKSSSTRSLSWRADKKRMTDHFYFIHKYADDYRLPKETIHASFTLLFRLFFKRPYRIFEFFTFYKALQKTAPRYFKQIATNVRLPHVFFLSACLAFIQLARRQIDAFLQRKPRSKKVE